MSACGVRILGPCIFPVGQHEPIWWRLLVFVVQLALVFGVPVLIAALFATRHLEAPSPKRSLERRRAPAHEDPALPGTARCPVCGGGSVSALVTRCPRCQTPHHEDCYQYAGGCAIYGCRR